MRTHLYRSVVLCVALLVICGLAYPLAGWALSQAAFRYQADGSIGANGSALIGQPWNDGTSINPMWFNGRPDPDNPLELNGVSGESGAQNYGPRSDLLVDFSKQLIAEWRAVGIDDPTPDLVTGSGSGLDPDLSVADARVQIPMVAKARGLSTAALQQLVNRNTSGAQWGFLGAPTVNVLQLNEALAAMVAAGR